METQHEVSHNPNYRRGKITGGIIIILIGVVLLLKEMGVTFPSWLVSWEMILIVIGIYTGFKHNFKHPSWIILITIGLVFLADDIADFSMEAYIWPVMLILLGVFVMFKPNKKHCDNHNWQRWEHKWRDKWEWENEAGYKDKNDFIESVTVFGGIKKNVLSKQFKGGEITCVFGGAEINLMQADINGTAVLEVNAVMGGAKLIVPANWEIHQQDLVAVMGGIEDKRYVKSETFTENENPKILVLRGTCFLGGIEIKSYT